MFGRAGDRQPQRMRLEMATVRSPHWTMPVWLWLLRKLFMGLWVLLTWSVRIYVRFWYAAVPATAIGWVWWRYGAITATATVLAIAAWLLVWRWKHRRSFMRLLGWFYLAQWRRWLVYRPNWYAVCANLGLAMAFGGERLYPSIVKVRRDPEGDVLTVRTLPGQHPNDWAKHAARFAHAFNVSDCTVRSATGFRAGQRVVLHMRIHDSLANTIAPLAIPASPDLGALPVAVRSGGSTVSISLTTHVLIAGASGSGKGSVLWAIIAALASGIRNGTVRVYAFDPKGGVELAAGRSLFHRFFFDDPAAMADALEELVVLMRQRQAHQRGKGRLHLATVDDPAIVVLIDEFATLTAYVGDKKLKDRITFAMSLLLSQGRAMGVHVVAALQDPRKEILPFRNLFGTRIALRLNEENEANLALTDDAVDRGAACHLIPKSLPGVGYMVLEEFPQPVRLRFPFHNDAALSVLAGRFTPAVNATAYPANVSADTSGFVTFKPPFEVNR